MVSKSIKVPTSLSLRKVPEVESNQSGCITLAFAGSPKCGAVKVAAQPVPSLNPQNVAAINVAT